MSTKRLDGRTAAITGGARGIGRSIAAALAGRGMTVVIGDVDLETARATAAELGERVHARPLDVTDEVSFAAFLDEADGVAGGLEVLVNNAGIMPVGAFLEEDPASTRRQVEINVFGVVTGCRLAVPRFKQRGSGQVVNVSSVAGLSGYPGMASYSGTKHFVRGFSEALRSELLGTGVSLSVVMPGFVGTELTAGIGDARFFKKISPDDVAAGVVRAIERPRFEVYVPRNLRGMSVAMGLLPRRVQDAALRFTRADRLALDYDPVQRRAYEERAARSAPAASTDHDAATVEEEQATHAAS
ncbi:MAG: SDR family oxidoreductase [Solirubrobacteraceae bacterium]